MKTEEDVKPISYVKANTMMKLIQLAEKDAEEGIKTPQDKVFKDIEKSVAGRGLSCRLSCG